MSSAATLTADHGHEAPTNTGIPNKKLAMWAFLASDCMFFGTLISTHLIYRQIDQSGFEPTSVLELNITSISTFVLLVSSVMMFLAVNAVHNGKKWPAIQYLSCVVLFGLIFLGFQFYEFSHFVHHYHLTLDSSIYGSTFYVMTGIHGCHVAVGVFWLGSIIAFMLSGKADVHNAIDIESAGLYWHFVDIVWIVIFTAVYLFEFI